MSQTSPQFDEYDNESTATKSNTIEKRKSIIFDEFSDLKIPAKGAKRNSFLVSQFEESEENQEWPKLGEINKDRSQSKINFRQSYQFLAHKAPQKKFKTELCKNWELTGKCNYRDKCQFAHGKQELMLNTQTVINQKYKSKSCKQYHSQQFCPYGIRCQFAHDMRDQESILSENFYQKTLNNLGELGIPECIPRLPIFQQLSQDRYCFSTTFPNPIGILLPKKI